MKVYMNPMPQSYVNHREESGIRRVVENYARHAPIFGIEYTDNIAAADLAAVHAGGTELPSDMPLVAHCHGLYWTADYPSSKWELRANRSVIDNLRRADAITVPTEWVAENIARDMRVMPHVLPHGIDWHEWQHNEESGGYVLWNKNRGADVCSPEPVNRLAREFKDVLFWTTFAERNPTPNVQYLNLTTDERPRIVPHDQMKLLVQQCGVYLSTTKETFGIGTLEAMAAGKPVLGFNHGGNRDLVKHGVSGYLANPGDWGDLFEGMQFCLEYGEQLGANGRELAKKWTWESVAERLSGIYEGVLNPEPPTIGVVIPRYQQPFEVVKRAIDSVLNQTHKTGQIVPTKSGDYYHRSIAVVNDGGQDSYQIAEYCGEIGAQFIDKENGGVASARNLGVENIYRDYILCLDADDWLEPNYLEVTAAALDANPLAGIAYTGLTQHKPDGTSKLSHWPPHQDYDRQCNYQRRYNQVISGALFRREAWERIGGYRGRYCPKGAGSEDAAFWTAIGSIGYEAVKVTDDGLFNYSLGGQVSGDPDYREVDWLAWYPWSRDGAHPFASVAKPSNHWSHPVRQYDEPVISVIIPVGPGHGDYVIDALDSLEAQHFRKWEVIIVDDTGEPFGVWRSRIEASFPYAKWMTTDGEGAGFARNVGARRARGAFLFFLDADDFLNPSEPGSFDEMMRIWGETQSAVYANYLGVAFIEDIEMLSPELQSRIISRDEDTKETVALHVAHEYDCARAIRQPESLKSVDKLYLWCNISTLIPKSWHDEIGGFDETMLTWEDVDYWYRMARSGKCFSRMDKAALVYRIHSGKRRELSHAKNEQGRHNWVDVVEYMLGKYEEIEPMPCSGCSKSKKRSPTPVPAAGVGEFADEQFVMAVYTAPNTGKHQVNGAPHFRSQPPMNYGKRGKFYYIKYGYHGGGGRNKFRVHIKDIESAPHLFSRVDEQPPIELPAAPRAEVSAPQPIERQAEPPTPVPPIEITKEVHRKGDEVKTVYKFNLELLPISPASRAALIKAGHDNADAIKALGADGLREFGIEAARADMVLSAIEKMEPEAESPPISELDGVTPRVLESLKDNGIDTVGELLETFGGRGDERAIKELTGLKHIGKKTAEKIWGAANSE
jgi:glycosyltransferase involved in cell wall biosynthesis